MSINQELGSHRWIGLATIQSLPGNNLLGSARGAIVAVVADADSVEAFLSVVERGLFASGFRLVSLEDVELLNSRMSRQQLPEELQKAIHAISDEFPVAFGPFHTYMT